VVRTVRPRSIYRTVVGFYGVLFGWLVGTRETSRALARLKALAQEPHEQETLSLIGV
jgi:hypothetical protein